MAIKDEAIEYLNKLEEETPNWTELPEDDERILKLRSFYRPLYKEHKGVRIRAVKGDFEKVYDSIKHCAEDLGFKTGSVGNAMRKQGVLYGYTFDRLSDADDELEEKVPRRARRELDRTGTFTLYKGDKVIATGTLEEIQKQTGVQMRTLMTYGQERYQSKTGNHRKLVKTRDE